MKTRKAGTSKSPAAKKTTPSRKSAAKTPPNPPLESGTASIAVTPKTNQIKSASGKIPPLGAESVAVTPKATETKSASAAKNPPNPPLEAGTESVTVTAQATETKSGPSGPPNKPHETESVVVTPKITETKSSSVAKSPPNLPPESATSVTVTPKTTENKSASVSKAKLVKDGKTTPNTSITSKTEQPVEQTKASVDAVEVTPETKVSSGVKTTKTVVRRTVIKKVPVRTKTHTSAKAVPRQTPKSGETEKLKVQECTQKEEGVDSVNKVESLLLNVEGSSQNVEPAVEKVEETKGEEDQTVMNVEEALKEAEKTGIEHSLVLNVENSTSKEDLVAVDIEKSSKTQEPGIARKEELMKEMEEMRTVELEVALDNEPVKMEEDTSVNMEEDTHANTEKDTNEELKGEDAPPGGEYHGEERMEDCRDKEVLEGLDEEELEEEEEEMQELRVETEALEEEHLELTAAAKERKIRKELEIFVGGLDRDVEEEDLKKAFENIGEVHEVRLHKNSSTNKNKGYAFVKFATKEQASRALSEVKNPIIRGKRCETAPSEDNDSLFLGNICNTWTKEAIKQKLKDYGIEGVENITLVLDARHEGLSRGFAFIEFGCHDDAMLAYKRLQKPDVIFGHPERTAKVAFAEPLREPDPEVMAEVKSVFLDGLAPQWDEDRVREKLKGYGEIVRIMLARNMSTAKRKDFGFVDFSTHEAAVACVEGISNINFGDGNSKAKVKARLSNPLPKTQAIKGGMCGGFRIGHSGAGSFSKHGRGFGRSGHAFNRPNFQHGRGFYPRGRGQTWRMGFTREHDLNMQHPPFQRREMFGRGGWRGSFGDAHDASGGGALPARPNHDRMRHDAPGGGHGRHIPTRRHEFPPEEGFNRPFGRHFDDPYFYDDRTPGMKRPFFMTDPEYVEPSRLRPRLDYPDPAVSYRSSLYRDSFGAGSSLYPRDYYGSDYGEGSYSSFYGNDRPYGGGYYY